MSRTGARTEAGPRRRTRWVLAVALALAAGLPAASASAGTWGAPAPLSTGEGAKEARIAGNGRGDAVVSFSGRNAAYAAVRRAHGPFVGPIRLARRRHPARVRAFAAGMDRAGDAFVGLIDDYYYFRQNQPCCALRVAIARPGEPFRIEAVSTPGESVSSPTLHVGLDGTAVATWTAGELMLESVGRPETGFAPPRVIGPTGAFALSAVDAGGHPLLLGAHARGDTSILRARDGDRDGRLGPRYRIRTAPTPDYYTAFNSLQLAPDRGVGGLATWLGPPTPEPSCCESGWALYTADWTRGGQRVAVQQLGTIRSAAAPTLASGPGGHALIAWPGNDVVGSSQSFGLHLAAREPGGPFQLTPGLDQNAFPYCCDPFEPQLSIALNRAGTAIVAWERIGQVDHGGPGSDAVIRHPDGSFEPVHSFGRAHLGSFDTVSGYRFSSTDAATIDGDGRATVLIAGHRLYAVDYQP